MRWLLNFFPRPWLIRLSLWFRPIIKWFYKGNRYVDPIDGSSYRKFLPYGYQKLRPNALCPGTLSLERHRLLWLYLERETNFLKQPLKVLHLAPEQVLYKKFKSYVHWHYITADLHSPLAEIKADICALPFKDGSFDLIFCNHVLEHIPDHIKAMEELYRVLKKGGTLIAQVPIDEKRETTFEDNSIIDEKERTKVFGQYDHVRIYGRDYYSFLNKVGFKSQAIAFASSLSEEELNRFGLQKDSIPLARKI